MGAAKGSLVQTSNELVHNEAFTNLLAIPHVAARAARAATALPEHRVSISFFPKRPSLKLVALRPPRSAPPSAGVKLVTLKSAPLAVPLTSTTLLQSSA